VLDLKDARLEKLLLAWEWLLLIHLVPGHREQVLDPMPQCQREAEQAPAHNEMHRFPVEVAEVMEEAWADARGYEAVPENHSPVRGNHPSLSTGCDGEPIPADSLRKHMLPLFATLCSQEHLPLPPFLGKPCYNPSEPGRRARQQALRGQPACVE
jgi:hypothetical protein